MDSSRPEPFRGLLLRHRGRTGLIQRDLATRAGVSVRSLQEWEGGVSFPTAERLRALVQALADSGGFTPGEDVSQARELWAAAERDASRMHTPFDEEWFDGVLEARASPAPRPALPDVGAADRARDWGDAPDTSAFVGRADELAQLRDWVLDEHSRLVAVVGFGGIGKTMLAAKLAQVVAPSFDRVYWRSVRNAPPVIEWLAGAIGFLSDQQLVPTAFESERIAALLQLLRDRRCLLVLDNSEALFEPGEQDGRYRADMDGYGRVIQAIGETSHQGCLLV